GEARGGVRRPTVEEGEAGRRPGSGLDVHDRRMSGRGRFQWHFLCSLQMK
uniref:Uncharacterized protein n=1 Tax=Aegilops tauschii subsp. strangulata TaxID=200361 RepID=A0A453DLD6_AEGTS